MKTNQIISIAILIVVASAASFFVGTKYQQRKTVSQFSQRAGFNNASPQDMGRNAADNSDNVIKNRGKIAGFRQTIGEILSIDDKSFTVKLADGSSKIVLFADTTVINQSIEAAKTDLEVGSKVAINGDQNTDGSIIGRSIEINPRVITITPPVKQ